MSSSNYTLVDFFCGAGGFTEGFRQMGFTTLYGYDYWQPATATYNKNYGLDCETKNISIFFDSIEEINSVPNTTVILGSPPCVSFSTSNKSGKAEKGLGLTLIKSFLRIIAVKKHQKDSILEGWFMENVANSKKYLQRYYTFADLNLTEWAKTIGKSHLDVALYVGSNTQIMNSADYGSHQSRKRSISGEIISLNKFSLPRPSHSEKGENLNKWRTLGDLLSRLPSPKVSAPRGIVIDPIYPTIQIDIMNLSDHFYDTGLYECEWRQSRELKQNHHCMGKMAFPENLNKPSRTVTATKCVTSREGLTYKSEYNRSGDGEYRSPTIRELASIMGFPITYQFTGNLYAKWRQVGNAVCPSISRALAKEFLVQNNYCITEELILQKEVDMGGILNLNSFKEASFETPPRRNKNAKFRRHPFKDGNLTVTLSNFDIKEKNKPDGRWLTSIQYGIGEKFQHQTIEDGFYNTLEEIIKTEIKDGDEFIKIINNGFTERIASADLMQMMYELQQSIDFKLEPTYLIENLKDIIKKISVGNKIYNQPSEHKIFQFKEKVPLSQILALYGVNKIVSIANQLN